MFSEKRKSTKKGSGGENVSGKTKTRCLRDPRPRDRARRRPLSWNFWERPYFRCAGASSSNQGAEWVGRPLVVSPGAQSSLSPSKSSQTDTQILHPAEGQGWGSAKGRAQAFRRHTSGEATRDVTPGGHAFPPTGLPSRGTECPSPTVRMNVLRTRVQTDGAQSMVCAQPSLGKPTNLTPTFDRPS